MPDGTLRDAAAPASVPRILVVDDDRRVRDLLEIALTAQGFAVSTASDGEEAVRCALGEHTDLVVLDVRLPKKSGLEVCEVLRANADNPWIPIIMVSAAAETEARLQGFARGADDYLGKPFSPKELIARIRRHLARAAEQGEAQRRARDLERDLARARDEARRAHVESHRLREGRDLVVTLAGDLLGVSDLDVLCRRLLDGVRGRLGTPVAALLLPARPGEPLTPAAVRGDRLWRIAGLEVGQDGALARVLAGLGRPTSVAEIGRLADIRTTVAPFIAARFDLLIPVRDESGLVGLIAAEERPDAAAWTRADFEILSCFTEVGAVALRAALRQRTLLEDLIETWAGRGASVRETQIRAEAAAVVRHAGSALPLAPPLPALAAHGIAFADHARDGNASDLERLAAIDSTGLAARLARLLEQALAPSGADESSPDDSRAAGLLATGIRYAASRHRGAGVREACAEALAEPDPRLDAAALKAFETAALDLETGEDEAAEPRYFLSPPKSTFGASRAASGTS